MMGELEPVAWQCQMCTYKNIPMDKKCSMCSINRGVIIHNIGMNEKVNVDESSELEKLRQSFENYLELAELDSTDLITCLDHFECLICQMTCSPGEGVVLKECLHTFCKECLGQLIEHSTEAEIRCPYNNSDYLCNSPLQEREIKALVNPDVYQKYLVRSVVEAEQKIQNTFHCKTVNCQGWCIIDENVDVFPCPVCGKSNCLKCEAIHPGMSCEAYHLTVDKKESDKASQTRLEDMLKSKEAMRCPNCKMIITKSTGCDGMQCIICKTELCWATRGARWGPRGRGDTSGGCKCGVNGRRCHPNCGNCH